MAEVFEAHNYGRRYISKNYKDVLNNMELVGRSKPTRRTRVQEKHLRGRRYGHIPEIISLDMSQHHLSNGLTPHGIQSGAAPRSAQAASIATLRRSQSGSVACRVILMSRDSDAAPCPGKLAEPLKWSSPKTIFVNSMSDLFQKDVPDWYVEQVGRVMQMADWHTYQVLTKRAEQSRHAPRAACLCRWN